MNGEAGSLAFDLHDPQWLSFFEYRAPAATVRPHGEETRRFQRREGARDVRLGVLHPPG